MWGAAAGSVISGIGSIVNSFFGFKAAQADVVSSALNTFSSITEQDRAYFSASAAAIDAVYTKGGWLERNWRPTLMWMCLGILFSRWFGYMPKGITELDLSNMNTFILIGLGGYMPLRSIDKWMQGFQIGSILKTLIQKKLA